MWETKSDFASVETRSTPDEKEPMPVSLSLRNYQATHQTANSACRRMVQIGFAVLIPARLLRPHHTEEIRRTLKENDQV